MAATLAVRDAGEPVPTKDGISAALAEHLETHGGIGSDRVKSIVFGGLDGVSESPGLMEPWEGKRMGVDEREGSGTFTPGPPAF